jgi:hypothetical protein
MFHRISRFQRVLNARFARFQLQDSTSPSLLYPEHEVLLVLYKVIRKLAGALASRRKTTHDETAACVAPLPRSLGLIGKVTLADALSV